MDKTIIKIKGLTPDNKFKYVYEDKKTNLFYFLDQKESATEYMPYEFFEIKEKIEKQIGESGYNIEKIIIEKFKVKK